MHQQALDLRRQERELNLLSLWFEKRRESKQPLVSPEVDQSHKGNEVTFDLPPKFDEYEDEQEKIKEEEKEDWEEKDEVTFEKVVEEAREEELLVLRRVPSQQKGVKDGSSIPSPTHPITKTLTQKFVL